MARVERSTDSVADGRGRAEREALEAVALAVEVVVLSVRDGEFRVLLTREAAPRGAGSWALPGGLVGADEPLDAAAIRTVSEAAGSVFHPAHLEQLRAYDTRGRHDLARRRVLSIAYVAVQPEAQTGVAATRPGGAGGAGATLPPADGDGPATEGPTVTRTPVADILNGSHDLSDDHVSVVREAVEDLRRDLGHTALATAFLPEAFTEAELRSVFEAVWGIEAGRGGPVLDPPNFHRSLLSLEPSIVERLPEKWAATGGRPAALYRASNAVRESGATVQFERQIPRPKATIAKRRLQ